MALARTLIAACLLIAIPLLSLSVLWLPAEILTLRDAARAKTLPGTASFRESTDATYRGSLVSIGVTVAALLCFSAASIVLLKPQSIAAIVVWLATIGTCAAHLATFTAAHPPHRLPAFTLLLFWGTPGAIAILASAGAITSVTLAIRRR